MKIGLFRLRPKKARVGDMEVHAGEMTIRIVLTSPQPTVAVSGRVTIDSSPALRSALLDLLCHPTAPILVIDLSAVAFLDTSGVATLLEASKAARERSAKLRVVGISGQPRILSDLTELDVVLRAAGSEVEFK
jgi:anti-sigma B factor antagonist